jgi:hypothetical protein
MCVERGTCVAKLLDSVLHLLSVISIHMTVSILARMDFSGWTGLGKSLSEHAHALELPSCLMGTHSRIALSPPPLASL